MHCDTENSSRGYREYIFLCGTRDYHAMDWFRSATLMTRGIPISIVTDSRGGEGYPDLSRDGDAVFDLIVIDKLLLSVQSPIGNVWRNMIKLFLLPAQVFILRKFSRTHPGALFFAHSMYYLWLAWLARVDFVGTPQGSDLLIKPRKSRVFRWLSSRAMRAARAISVDSAAMAEAAYQIAGIRAHVIQNGVDVSAITHFLSQNRMAKGRKNLIVSPRAVSPLYRIDRIVSEIKNGHSNDFLAVFIYPFFDQDYKELCFGGLHQEIMDRGRVDRRAMYEYFQAARLVVSIPESDSSPRSVYEAIFCGAPVAISYNAYFDALPSCMKSRVIVVDVNERGWLTKALARAEAIAAQPVSFSQAVWDLFDQTRSIEKLVSLANYDRHL